MVFSSHGSKYYVGVLLTASYSPDCVCFVSYVFSVVGTLTDESLYFSPPFLKMFHLLKLAFYLNIFLIKRNSTFLIFLIRKFTLTIFSDKVSILISTYSVIIVKHATSSRTSGILT